MNEIEIVHEVAVELYMASGENWIESIIEIEVVDRAHSSQARKILEGGDWEGLKVGVSRKIVENLQEYTAKNNFVKWNKAIIKVTPAKKVYVEFIWDEEQAKKDEYFATLYPNHGPDRELARAISKKMWRKWRKIGVTSVYTPTGRIDQWYKLNDDDEWIKCSSKLTGKAFKNYLKFTDDNHHYANNVNPYEPFNVAVFQVWNQKEFPVWEEEAYFEVRHEWDQGIADGERVLPEF